MTNEELLQKINDRLNECTTHDYAPANLAIALRKVVELHRPNPIPHLRNAEEVTLCWCAHTYPCETIRAIEKELE